jgi:uracil-DNA glycosylase
MARTWDLEPDLLVVAAGPDAPLLIVAGAPEAVVAREEGRFLIGLLGAVLAIGSALVGAIALGTR